MEYGNECWYWAKHCHYEGHYWCIGRERKQLWDCAPCPWPNPVVLSTLLSVVSPKIKITHNREFSFCRTSDPVLPNKAQTQWFGAEGQHSAPCPFDLKAQHCASCLQHSSFSSRLSGRNQLVYFWKHTQTFGYKCWNRSPRSSTKSPLRETMTQMPGRNKYHLHYMKHFKQQNINEAWHLKLKITTKSIQISYFPFGINALPFFFILKWISFSISKRLQDWLTNFQSFCSTCLFSTYTREPLLPEVSVGNNTELLTINSQSTSKTLTVCCKTSDCSAKTMLEERSELPEKLTLAVKCIAADHGMGWWDLQAWKISSNVPHRDSFRTKKRGYEAGTCGSTIYVVDNVPSEENLTDRQTYTEGPS